MFESLSDVVSDGIPFGCFVPGSEILHDLVLLCQALGVKLPFSFVPGMSLRDDGL